MLYEFPYKWLEALEIPDRNLVGVYEAKNVKPEEPPASIVKRALENPIGSEKLELLANKAENVLILSDDNTRYTPAQLLIPHILERLKRGGVADDRIAFLIAKGTHRKMSREELCTKLGTETTERFPVFQHHSGNADMLTPVGHRFKGIDFRVNRMLSDFDLVIGMGTIIPHCIKGYSGGGNIILPGVSSTDAIGTMHWLNLDYFGEKILGVRDNPVRELIDTVARKAGLGFILNTIVNNDTEILDAVSGDPVEAHRKGAEIASKVYTVPVTEKGDIVIFDAFQNDLDFWQSTKGLIPAYVCMKENAVVIDVADCPEGICHNIPEVEANGFTDLDRIMELHNSGSLHPVVSHNLISVHRVVTERGRCIMVSRGITKDSAESTGLMYAADVKDALGKAFSMKGPDARVIVLRHAGNIRPLIGTPETEQQHSSSKCP